MSTFEYNNDIREPMRHLRVNIADLFGYEDCAVLLKDENLIGGYYALSPNLTQNFIKSENNCDLFYYTDKKGITV